jgi:hypothetical protein
MIKVNYFSPRKSENSIGLLSETRGEKYYFSKVKVIETFCFDFKASK